MQSDPFWAKPPVANEQNHPLAAIFHHSGDGILLLDLLSPQRHQANPALFDMLKLPPDVKLDGALLQMFSPSEADNFAQLLHSVVSKAEKHWIELPVKRLDGEEILVEVSISPVLAEQADRAGQPTVTQLVCILRDVTERRQIEAALQASEAKFRTLADWTSDWELWIDAQGKLVYVSRSVQAVTSYTVEEILDQPDLIDQMVHPEDLEMWNAHQRSHLYRKVAVDQRDAGEPGYHLVTGPDELEYRIVTREGEVRWLHHRCLPVFDNEGNYAGRRTSSRDVTQRHRDQDALREQEERLRLFIDAAPVAVVISRLTGEIVLVNERAERLMGYDRAELLGQSVDLLLPERLRKKHAEHRADYADHPEVRRKEGKELLARRKDGSELYVEIHLSHIQTPDGPMVVSHLVDATSRKQAEDALWRTLAQEQELSELKSRFISLTSHSFRNPLAAILATSETLVHYWQRMDPDKIHERLARISGQVAYMTDLLEDIQHMNHMETGQIVYKPAPCHLGLVCQAVIDEIVRGNLDLGDRIHYQAQATLPEIQADPSLMHHMFKHLIANGLKYSPADRPVSVDLFQEADHLTFRVVDQGIGIPVEDQARLFEPFHRANNVGAIPGTGLGLSIVQRVVSLHRGSIQVQSEADQGATFTVRIPMQI
jgi:PAS domain S-box-containing protein